MDNQSGYLQFYSTTADLLSNASIPTHKPKISFFKYIGKKGITNLDVSGQQQVADISGIDTMLNGINRMILPDGYVDISRWRTLRSLWKRSCSNPLSIYAKSRIYRLSKFTYIRR